MPWPRLIVGLLLAATIAIGAVASVEAQHPARHVNEEAVYEVAARLRCVVCQNLSVADSPSEMATQMRAVVRERLASGESPEQVIRYFEDKYGEWILLEPRRQGFTLLLWILPPLALAGGLAVVGVLLARWTRRRRVAMPAAPRVDAALSERIRREMETEA